MTPVGVGAGLETAARGLGHRQVAAHLGRAEGTVRGWIRRFRGPSEDVRRYFTIALVALADAPVMPDSSGTPLVDAVSATAAAHRAAAVRWARMNTVSRSKFAGRSAQGHPGRLLHPRRRHRDTRGRVATKATP
jgi:hypothetical protein